IFTQPGADPEFGPRFLQTMLGQDPRFVWRPADGTWNAQLHATLARPLSDTRFVVVDLETTGVGTSPGAIIEIGAVRVHAGRPTAEFQQLVRPSGAIPRFITSLTGIDGAMLAEQPGIAEVWPRFVAFLGDDVLVAHNANYDLGFLSAAAVAFSGRPVTN